jgi:hypothetical protein
LRVEIKYLLRKSTNFHENALQKQFDNLNKNLACHSQLGLLADWKFLKNKML